MPKMAAAPRKNVTSRKRAGKAGRLLNFVVTDEEHRAFTRRAKQLGETLSAWARRLLRADALPPK